MAENSAIEWTTHTLNFWLGCTAITPACDNCYARAWAKRTGQPELWEGQRRETTLANRYKAHKWNREAEASGERPRVFTNSLADFFDNQVPYTWRREAWHIIDQTPNLDWMILTKRPQNIAKMLPDPETGVPAWGEGWRHVWLGTTVEDRQRLVNIDHLRRVPAAVRFLSIEPLLEDLGTLDLTGIHLVIVGGESGKHARPMHPDWARSIRDQCAAAGTAFFFKQWGEWLPGDERYPEYDRSLPLRTLDNGVWRETTGEDADYVARYGKKAAGRLLDGVTHDAMPQVRA